MFILEQKLRMPAVNIEALTHTPQMGIVLPRLEPLKVNYLAAVLSIN